MYNPLFQAAARRAKTVNMTKRLEACRKWHDPTQHGELDVAKIYSAGETPARVGACRCGNQNFAVYANRETKKSHVSDDLGLRGGWGPLAGRGWCDGESWSLSAGARGFALLTRRSEGRLNRVPRRDSGNIRAVIPSVLLDTARLHLPTGRAELPYIQHGAGVLPAAIPEVPDQRRVAAECPRPEPPRLLMMGISPQKKK